MDRAIGAGDWESVGELAVLMSDDSRFANDLNSTAVDESLDDSLVVDSNSLNQSGLGSQSDGPIDEGVGSRSDKFAAMAQKSHHVSADADNSNRKVKDLNDFVELEDPSDFFMTIEDDTVGNAWGWSERWGILALSCVVMTGIYYS